MKSFQIGTEHDFPIYKILLVAILATFTIISTFYSLYAPAFEGPDEQYHYSYTKLIVENDLSESRYLQTGPLYYTVLSPLLKTLDFPETIEIRENWSSFSKQDPNRFKHFEEEKFPFTGTSKSVHLLRLVSISFGILTVFFTYKIATLFFVRKDLALFTTAIVAFTPKFTWINSVLNSDVLVWLLSTIAIFFMFKLVHEYKNFKLLILLGIFVGLANLTKANAIFLFPLLVVLFAYLFFSKKTGFKTTIRNFLITLSVSIISGGWYILHKMYLTLDPTNLNLNAIIRSSTVATKNTVPDFNYQIMLDRLMNWDLLHFRTVDMLWNNLGWHVISSSKYLTTLVDIGLVFAVSGLFVFFIRRKQFHDISINKGHLVIVLFACAFMLSAMLFYVSRSGSGDVRYTFPFISCFALLITLGTFVYLGNKKRKFRLLLALPIIFLVLLNINLIETMDQKFDHGFKKYDVNIYGILLDVYDSRQDLQKAFPEVKNDNFKRLFAWAERYGVKEMPILLKNKPLIELVNIYYSSSHLQKTFPEVMEIYDLDKLVTWAIDEGTDEYPELRNNKRYYDRYITSI